MRHALLVLSLLVACSKGGDKDKAQPGAGPTPATPGKKEMSITGTVTIGGAMTAKVSLPPGQDIATCVCINDKQWTVEATYSDGADTFVALSINSTNGMTLTSGKLSTPEPLKSEGTAGFSGSCKPDHRNTDGVISIDLDGKLTGKAGEVTVKGHLDVVCRTGL